MPLGDCCRSADTEKPPPGAECGETAHDIFDSPVQDGASAILSGLIWHFFCLPGFGCGISAHNRRLIMSPKKTQPRAEDRERTAVNTSAEALALGPAQADLAACFQSSKLDSVDLPRECCSTLPTHGKRRHDQDDSYLSATNQLYIRRQRRYN